MDLNSKKSNLKIIKIFFIYEYEHKMSMNTLHNIKEISIDNFFLTLIERSLQSRWRPCCHVEDGRLFFKKEQKLCSTVFPQTPDSWAPWLIAPYRHEDYFTLFAIAVHHESWAHSSVWRPRFIAGAPRIRIVNLITRPQERVTFHTHTINRPTQSVRGNWNLTFLLFFI